MGRVSPCHSRVLLCGTDLHLGPWRRCGGDLRYSSGLPAWVRTPKMAKKLVYVYQYLLHFAYDRRNDGPRTQMH